MVVYQPELDAFRVDLTGLGGPVAVEWFDRVASVALLRCGSNHALSLRSVESAAKELREQAITYLRWQTAVEQRFGNWLAVRAPVQGARGRLRIRGGFRGGDSGDRRARHNAQGASRDMAREIVAIPVGALAFGGRRP